MGFIWVEGIVKDGVPQQELKEDTTMQTDYSEIC